jgi:hypothetical protein
MNPAGARAHRPRCARGVIEICMHDQIVTLSGPCLREPVGRDRASRTTHGTRVGSFSKNWPFLMQPAYLGASRHCRPPLVGRTDFSSAI